MTREAFIRSLVASITLSGCGNVPPRSSCDGFVSTPFVFTTDGGPTTCVLACAERFGSCESDAGPNQYNCKSQCVGRPPLELRLTGGGRGVGGHLARMAALEAASVDAFERLARELAAHGAPARLVSAAKQSARDERRHARLVRGLADARGASAVKVGPMRSAPRPFFALALENATSGCVVETYGAIEGTWQSVHAADPDVRRVMGRVAPDEARHAELSWAVHRWAEPRLTATERRTVARAQRAAIARLQTAVVPRFARTLGLPTAGDRAQLLGQLDQHLWS